MNDLTKKDFIEKYKDGKFDFAVQNTCRAVEYAKLEDCFNVAERNREPSDIIIYEDDDMIDYFHFDGLKYQDKKTHKCGIIIITE